MNSKKWAAIMCFAATLLGANFGYATAVPKAEVWMFCGGDPLYDPIAGEKAARFAEIGADAAFGPCLTPSPGYSPAFPGSRYADPVRMSLAVDTHAHWGLKTLIYDARFWSDNPATRQDAINFWRSRIDKGWIRAIDMGDEFSDAEWSILEHRWNIILTYITPVTGIGPYTNHNGSAYYLDKALSTLPSAGVHLSYDIYYVDASLAMARSFRPRVRHLMCAISATPDIPGAHANNPSPLSRWRITNTMGRHRAAGCGSFLIFNAGDAYNPPFAGTKTVNTHSSPVSVTDWGWGVRDGSSYSVP